MKVELQCGDTITIPEGCKAIVKEGSVVFEKDFEDGDVLHSIYDDLMLIYKERLSSESFNSHFNMIHTYNKGWNIHSFRHASEEEKAELFAKMKEKGLKWNAEEKRVEMIRWRAEEGKIYYYVNNEMYVSSTLSPKVGENLYDYEGRSFFSYNYFRTKEQAKEAAKRVKDTLKKYHEEIGE